jgi:cell division transport system permease protein
MDGMSFRRVVKSGWKNFTRGGAVSAATVVVMTVTLAIIGGLLFLSALLTFTLDAIRDKVDVSVYFVTTASEVDILSLKEKIEQFPQVEAVTYVSREEALDDFRERHATDQTILQGLAQLDDNPLSAYLGVRAKDPALYESIVSSLETTPALSSDGTSIIDRINYDQNREAIDRLSQAIDATRDIGFGVVIIFALASILIAFATIRLAIYTSRDEIGVMRLVGASNAYIRGPFIVAGMITGVLSALIVLFVLFPLAWYGGAQTTGWLGGFNLFTYYTQNFFFIFAILLAIGIFLGGAASLLAIRRYLKV